METKYGNMCKWELEKELYDTRVAVNNNMRRLK